MWELDCEESWALKNWCFWTAVLEKTLDSPLDCKELQPVHSEGDQPWDFFGRNDAKAETPVLWPPHVKSWSSGKDWCWEGLEAGGERDDRGWDGWMASLTRWTWSEWTLGVGDRQGGLACWDSWGRKESDMTERLNWTEAVNPCKGFPGGSVSKERKWKVLVTQSCLTLQLYARLLCSRTSPGNWSG